MIYGTISNLTCIITESLPITFIPSFLRATMSLFLSILFFATVRDDLLTWAGEFSGSMLRTWLRVYLSKRCSTY